jgi:hypothetical protein
MTSDRYMIIFSRTEPWSSLGLFRRAARVLRITFGSVLFGSLVVVALLAIRTMSSLSSVRQVLFCLAVVPFAALLAWSVGCMFIWRATHSPAEPSSDGSPPAEPPSEGAPRPAPLRPFSPLILSAHAELPNERIA